MEALGPQDQLKQTGEEILRKVNRGEGSIFDLFRRVVVPKINYGSEKVVEKYSPDEVFTIAMNTLSHNYGHSEFDFALIVLYHALDLNPDNVVEKLKPFLGGPQNTDIKGGFLRDKLTVTSLVVAEDYLGLKRDTLFTPFSDKNWINEQEHINRSKGIPALY